MGSIFLVLRALVFCAVGSWVVGCSRPEPPTLVPKEARVVALGLAGFDVELRVEAYNPNRIDLSARSVSGKVVVDGKYDLGMVGISRAVSLPGKARTMVDVPLSVKWSDLGTLALLAGGGRSVPYRVEGTANIGGERFNVDVPFAVDGVISQDQLLEAATRSVPGLRRLR